MLTCLMKMSVFKKSKENQTAKSNPQLSELEEKATSSAKDTITGTVTSIRYLNDHLFQKAIRESVDAVFTCEIAEVTKTFDCQMLERLQEHLAALQQKTYVASQCKLALINTTS